MKLIYCKQGEIEWHSIRLGMITASSFSKVLCKGKGRELYLRRLTKERLKGRFQNTYTSESMEWGKEQEHCARKLYQRLKKVKVQQVGFVKYDDYIGCSPDGLVGKDGLVEIKCPNTSTHIRYLKKCNLPSQYIPQVQGQLWITGRQWCDFVSFDPRHKKNFHVFRVWRDDTYIKILSISVEQFKADLIKRISQPKNKKRHSKIQQANRKLRFQIVFSALSCWAGLIWFLGSYFYPDEKTSLCSLYLLAMGLLWYYVTKVRIWWHQR